MKTKKPEPGSPLFADAVRRTVFLGMATGKMFLHSTGEPAGINEDGEAVPVVVNGKRYPPEKISWLLNTGQWPKGNIGFKNGIRMDFRYANLFEVVSDKQVTITKQESLYVVHNGSEQVMTTEFLDQAVQMVRSILEG